MADSALQEIELSFAGKAYKIRPDFRTIVGIESATGQPSRTLGLKFLAFEASVTEIVAALVVVLATVKDAPKRDDIGDLVMEFGYADLMIPLGELLLRAQKGHKEHEREAAEQAKRKAEQDKMEGRPPGPS
jgi:hypothetical protein